MNDIPIGMGEVEEQVRVPRKPLVSPIKEARERMERAKQTSEENRAVMARMGQVADNEVFMQYLDECIKLADIAKDELLMKRNFDEAFAQLQLKDALLLLKQTIESTKKLSQSGTETLSRDVPTPLGGLKR